MSTEILLGVFAVFYYNRKGLVGMGKRSSTQWMLETLSKADGAECKNFPPEFICGLRAAMDAGLSCEQLTAMIVLFAGIYEAAEKMSGPELVEKAEHLAGAINADICYFADKRERVQRKREAKTRKVLIVWKKKRRVVK